jgi:predicted HicB family RNase H-like nuclease
MNIKIINLAMRWQENVEQTLTEKKAASVASLNQLVQHEMKKS